MPDPLDHLDAADRHLAEGLTTAYQDAKREEERRNREAAAAFPGLFTPAPTQEPK